MQVQFQAGQSQTGSIQAGQSQKSWIRTGHLETAAFRSFS